MTIQIEYDGQLVTTSLTVVFRGRSILINDVIIDTGSSYTIFSPDILETIGVKYEKGDYVLNRMVSEDRCRFIVRN